jgi:hypothetical protein
MSWIIQSLLNNQDSIRETADIESDQFNDLILVEKAIQKLSSDGLLTESDLAILEFFRNVKTDKEEERPERHTVSKRYIHICDRIGYYLGGYFTDEGYLTYMCEKYNLTDEQMEILRNFIKSSYRHKIVRKVSSNGYKK